MKIEKDEAVIRVIRGEDDIDPFGRFVRLAANWKTVLAPVIQAVRSPGRTTVTIKGTAMHELVWAITTQAESKLNDEEFLNGLVRRISMVVFPLDPRVQCDPERLIRRLWLYTDNSEHGGLELEFADTNRVLLEAMLHSGSQVQSRKAKMQQKDLGFTPLGDERQIREQMLTEMRAVLAAQAQFTSRMNKMIEALESLQNP